jgi:phosphatidylserine decarboxylase
MASYGHGIPYDSIGMRQLELDANHAMRLTPYGRREWLTYGTGLTAVALLSLFLFPAGWWLPALGACFVIMFFRDPERKIAVSDDVLLSPADGTVVDIGEIDEPDFIGGKALRIGIFMSILSVHVNRMPCSGRVEYLKHSAGEYRNATSASARMVNESNLLGVTEATRGVRISVRQIVGSIARRIVCACRVGDTVSQGERFGMIKFGSRLEVMVPLTALFAVSVVVRDKVRAGVTVLGKFGSKAASI